MSKNLFLNIASGGEAKKQLEKDDNGYYKICLGAINSFNSTRDFYLADGFEEMVKDINGPLGSKIANGNLMGEAGHPDYINGQTKEEFYKRILKIDLSNVSHHIREVFTKPTNIPSGIAGKGNVIAVYGWVKPIGKLGETLRDSLENPDQNTCFSIRSFTNDTVVGGINYKRFSAIITWDWVVSPGIRIANKFNTLTMENLYDRPVDMNLINNISFELEHKKVANEDDKVSLSYLESIKKNSRTEDEAFVHMTNW